MKLHFHPLSSYSRKAAIGIGLREDPVELCLVDVFGGGLNTPAFLELSPFGKMPVLETPEGSVYESTSILEYLEERRPAGLLPKGRERLARHFDRVADLYLLEPIGQYFWKKTEKIHTDAEETTAKAWAVFCEALADGRPFVAGDAITLGDLAAAVAAHYAETEGLPLPDAIRAYSRRLYAHPVLAASRDAALPFIEATRPLRVVPTG